MQLRKVANNLLAAFTFANLIIIINVTKSVL